MRHPLIFSSFVLAAGLSLAAPQPGSAEIRTIEITASRFAYDPSVIEVDQDDHVVLRFHTADIEHGFALEEFGLRTVIPASGETVSIDFIANRAGRFTFTCSQYCGAGHPDMRGTLVVRPRPGNAAPLATAAPPLIDPVEPDFEVVTVPTTARLVRHRMAFRITHRFTRPLAEGDFGDLAADLFGLDSSAVVGLGLRYGLTRTTQLGLYRVNSERVIEISLRQEFLNQGESLPFTLAAVGSIEGENNFGLSTGEDQDEAFSPTLALLLSRRLGERAALYVAPTFVGNSNLHPPRPDEDNNSLVLGLGARLRVLDKLYVSAEVTPTLAGFRGTRGDGTKSAPQIAFAIEKRLGGHFFALDFQNAFGTTRAQVARAQDNLTNDWYLGFRISRKFY